MFGGGGYGNDGTFAGGGFMNSQAGFDGANQTQTKEKSGQGNETLRAVTIRQLVRDVANQDDDNFKVDGVILKNVTIVGKILNIQELPANQVLTVHDGTGQLEVQQWTNNGGDFGADAPTAYQVGTYVRVFGQLRTFAQKKTFNSYATRLVTDHNEVTYHNLQCIYQHLHLKHGGPGTGVDNGMAAGGGLGVGGAGYGGPGAAPLQHNGAGYGAPYSGGGGSDACESAILGVLRTSQCGGNGMHVKEVARLVGGQFTQQQVFDAVQALQNNGVLYSTCDDEHVWLTG